MLELNNAKKEHEEKALSLREAPIVEAGLNSEERSRWGELTPSNYHASLFSILMFCFIYYTEQSNTKQTNKQKTAYYHMSNAFKK